MQTTIKVDGVESPKVRYRSDFLRRALPTSAFVNPFTAGFLLEIEKWILKNMRRHEKLELWRITNLGTSFNWNKP